MVKLIRAFIFIIVLWPIVSSANETINNERATSVHNSIKAASPEQVVKEFYHNYLIGIDTSDTEMKDKAIDAYVTLRLKNEINASDIDWDYYIDAQDICNYWLGNIKIGQVDILNNKAKLKLILGNESCKSAYKIKLLKGLSGWKIDGVVLLKRFNKSVR